MTVTQEQIVAAARVLCKRASDSCNIDNEDNWKTYGEEYLGDAMAALEAAEVLRLNGVGGEAVAWLYTLFGCSGEIANREASTINWDERYQPFGRPGIDFHEDGVVRKEPLYTAPQPQQAAPGAVLEGWKLEKVVAALADGGSVGVKATRLNGSTHVFWKDGWKGVTSPSEKAAFDVLNAMLSAAPKPQGE